ncbi:MAG: RHS repeat-associated core domain-containing protein [Ignavibacteriae bacterium]|nr:RHS repeat-associated core domain-containing protein [Ignavibacteriota bacterium]
MIKQSCTVKGKPSEVHYPDGTTELFKYDPEGSLHRYYGRDGIIQVLEYDYLGRLEHVEYYQRGATGSRDGSKRKYYYYDVFGLTSEKDENDHNTYYYYDQADRLSRIQKGDIKVEFSYDSLGRAHRVKEWSDSNTFSLHIREYDLLDRVTEERTENHEGTTLLKQAYTYDSKGQLIEVIGYPQNQKSILSQYEYDNFGRLCKITDPFNQVSETIYDDQYINERGQKVEKRLQVNPLGHQTEETFDPAGHLVKITRKNNGGKLLAESESFFDSLGNKTREKTSVIPSGEHLKTFITERSYGTGSQLQSITYAASSPEAKTTTFSYNCYGDLIEKHQVGSKAPISYKYDDQGNLCSISYPDQSKKLLTHQLSYDNKGNITKVKLATDQQLKYSFNANSQPLFEEIQDAFGFYKLGYSYNANGQIQQVELPDGSSINYQYEGPLVKRITRLTKENTELYSHQMFSYDQMGNLLEEILLKQGGARTQVWDQGGRKTAILTDFFEETVPKDGYDHLHNLKKIEVAIGGKKSSSIYDYDELQMLISEKGESNNSYSYDSLGNRLQKNDTSYKNNNLNQLLQTDKTSYTFDASGNLLTKTIRNQNLLSQEETWSYQFNPLNQLILVITPTQSKISFTYDLNGRRLTKRVESEDKKNVKVFRYFYLGNIELGCLDEKGTILELKIPVNPNTPDPSISIEIKGQAFVPVYNLQDSIVCLIHPEKREIVESYQYSAYGEEKIFNPKQEEISSSSVKNPWRFFGKRVDEETGLVYFGNRYYDPEIGRWISPDPLGDIDSPNLYLFVLNNPLQYTDYFGLAAEVNSSQNKKVLDYFFGNVEPHCHCETHRDCKRGGIIQNFSSSIPVTFPKQLSSNPFIRSRVAEVGTKELAGGVIVFVNGMGNTFEEALQHPIRMSEQHGGVKIHFVYDGSHGLAWDISEAILQRLRMPNTTERLLSKTVKSCIKKYGSDTKFLIIGHSKGTLNIKGFLRDAPPSIQEKITVAAFAPATIIPQSLCTHAQHYITTNDFVPTFDILRILLYSDQVTFLKSKPYDSDHGFAHSIYQPKIDETIDSFSQRLEKRK